MSRFDRSRWDRFTPPRFAFACCAMVTIVLVMSEGVRCAGIARTAVKSGSLETLLKSVTSRVLFMSMLFWLPVVGNTNPVNPDHRYANARQILHNSGIPRGRIKAGTKLVKI